MATIYHYETGEYMAEGLQGSNVCDEAWQAACALAADRGVPVMLEDDDGDWIVYPDGSRSEQEQSK